MIAIISIHPIVSVLIFTIFVIALYRWRVYRANKGFTANFSDYVNAEQEANFARKKEIPEYMFFVPDIAALPLDLNVEISSEDSEEGIDAEEEVEIEVGLELDYNADWHSRRRDAIIAQSGKKMIKTLSDMSNRELKIAFGATNLSVITEYEENYWEYIRLLNDYASALIKAEKYEEAKTTVSECIKAGSDVSTTYKLMAEAIALSCDTDDRISDLGNFYREIEEFDLQEHTRRKIKDYIQEKIFEIEDEQEVITEIEDEQEVITEIEDELEETQASGDEK